MASHADDTVQGLDAAGGADTGSQDRNEPKFVDYIQFKTLPPGGPLNRWSHAVTREHDFPGAQVRSFSRFLMSLFFHCFSCAKTRRKPAGPARYSRLGPGSETAWRRSFNHCDVTMTEFASGVRGRDQQHANGTKAA